MRPEGAALSFTSGFWQKARMLVLRSIVFNVAFYALLVVMMIVGLPLILVSAQAVRRWAQLWARLSVGLLKILCGVQVEVRGTENIPSGGFILAAKHQSFLDILLLLPLLPAFIFVLKRELTWIPIFGLYLSRAGMISIDRSKGRAVLVRLTKQVGEALRRGQELVIFPEGTRRAPGAEPAYKSGVAHLYAGTGVPCLPVALNSGLAWPRRSFLRLPARVVVDVLPLIAPGLPKDVFLVELQRRIETASNQLLPAG